MTIFVSYLATLNIHTPFSFQRPVWLQTQGGSPLWRTCARTLSHKQLSTHSLVSFPGQYRPTATNRRRAKDPVQISAEVQFSGPLKRLLCPIFFSKGFQVGDGGVNLFSEIYYKETKIHPPSTLKSIVLFYHIIVLAPINRSESEEYIACSDLPWLWNSGQASPAVQNRCINGPTKRTCVLEKKLKRRSFGTHGEYIFSSRENIDFVILYR